jgi:hypothetical protein
LHTNFSEIISLSTKLSDFCGAHKSEVQWIEKEHNILSIVVFQTYLLELFIGPCLAFEMGCCFLNSCFDWVVKGMVLPGTMIVVAIMVLVMAEGS